MVVRIGRELLLPQLNTGDDRVAAPTTSRRSPSTDTVVYTRGGRPKRNGGGCCCFWNEFSGQSSHEGPLKTGKRGGPSDATAAPSTSTIFAIPCPKIAAVRSFNFAPPTLMQLREISGRSA